MKQTRSLAHDRAQPLNRRILSVAIAQAIFGLSAAHAATIEVNSAADGTSPSACTLRDAIISANTDTVNGGCAAGSGVDTINFDALTLPATILLTNGQMIISTPMTLQGPGQDQLSIDAGGLSRVLRVDDSDQNGEIDVTVDGMTLTGGAIPGTFIEGFNGAGIRNAENLTLSNSLVTGNAETGNAGGGLYVRRGIVNIVGTTISLNSGQYAGGGIWNIDGAITLTDSSITGNSTPLGKGGGIEIDGGAVSLLRTIVTGNTAARDGGGIAVEDAELTLEASEVSSNNSPLRGGGIGISWGANVSINNSTLASNITSGVEGQSTSGRGGAIYISSFGNAPTTLSMTNSTISGNSAESEGGGIQANRSTVTLSHLTFSDNTAATRGAGLNNFGSSTIHLSNSVIANSTGEDCNDLFGAFATNVNNLIEDGTCSNGAVGQITGDPNLGSLQDNGGPTATHNLLTGSLAFDAGDAGLCTETDQRGVTRGASCDLGATEHAIIVDTVLDNFVVDNFCSLREAVTSANFDSPEGGCAAGNGDDTILFAEQILPGTITMNGSNIGVYSSVNILGPGADRLTISGNNSSRILRITDSDTTTMQNISLEGLTLTGGRDTTGGAIRNYEENLAISSCVITGNSATSSGGGIWNYGTLTISDSTFTDNVADTRGGAFYNQQGTATVTNSVISNNSGYAVSSNGTLNIVSSSIRDNQGSGVFNFGDATITDSTISNNSAYSGGGISTNSDGYLLVENSTITGNTASPGSGGGISVQQGSELTLVNSTVSGNSATRRGGGVAVNRCNANLNNSTISNNTAVSEGGGGLWHGYSGTINLTNTVIANSEAANDCVQTGGSFEKHLNNLIEDGSCDVPGAVNLLSGDPMLGPLQDNGGPTHTQALLKGSPLIDAADVTECAGLSTDQRGKPRRLDGTGEGTAACDIGAYEFLGEIVFFNGFELRPK